MKKFLSSILCLCLTFCFSPQISTICSAQTNPMLCIVIDDFGEDRAGVKEMLELNIPLTCAVMPNLTFTKQDAETAHANGHEVILHMPFESSASLPQSWYGPTYIKKSDSPVVAINKLEQCLSSVPYAKGINFHMGAALEESKKTITEIISYTKQHNLCFLDSKTSEQSICREVCKNTQTCFLERDFFLEKHGAKSVSYAENMLNEAIKKAKKTGFSIVIGHVGPEGGLSTFQAIKNCLPLFKQNNIQIVPLSKIHEKQQIFNTTQLKNQ